MLSIPLGDFDDLSNSSCFLFAAKSASERLLGDKAHCHSRYLRGNVRRNVEIHDHVLNIDVNRTILEDLNRRNLNINQAFLSGLAHGWSSRQAHHSQQAANAVLAVML